MKLGLFHFQLLYQILEQIHYLYTEDELAESVLKGVSTALNAEGGTIFKLLPDQKLYPLAAFGVSLEKLRAIPFQHGRGVAGWVVEHGQPVKVDKPENDQRFGGKIDAITGFRTKSIVAAPILAKGNVVGVIEFLNRADGPFSIPDLEMVSMIGREVGIAFENVKLVGELKRTQALLDATAMSLAAGMLIVDKEGKLLKLNPSGFRILDISEPESSLVHQPISNFLSGYAPLLSVIKDAINSQEPIRRLELRLLMKKGERVIGYSAVPVKDPQGFRLGTAILFQDITDFTKKA